MDARAGRTTRPPRTTGQGEPAVEDLLGPLLAAVMRVVWTQGETTVGAVTEELHRRQPRKRAYTTVMTVMGRLYERGLLHRESVGRRYVYRPAMDETALVEAMSERAVDELLERYGTTALRQFAHRLADLTPDLRAQLIDLAERRDRP